MEGVLGIGAKKKRRRCQRRSGVGFAPPKQWGEALVGALGLLACFSVESVVTHRAAASFATRGLLRLPADLVGFKSHNLFTQPVVQLSHSRLDRLQLIGRVDLGCLPD